MLANLAYFVLFLTIPLAVIAWATIVVMLSKWRKFRVWVFANAVILMSGLWLLSDFKTQLFGPFVYQMLFLLIYTLLAFGLSLFIRYRFLKNA